MSSSATLPHVLPRPVCRGHCRHRRLRWPLGVTASSLAPLPSTASAEDARMAAAFARQFKSYDVERAYESWARTVREEKMVEVRHPSGLQQAVGHVAGLHAQAWYDIDREAGPRGGEKGFWWAAVLEEHAGEIQAELAAALAPTTSARLSKTGSNVWSPAARADALAYGPEWRTLALQDRGKWDSANEAFFPRTVQLVRDVAGAPSLECFFARQAGGSGIKAHSDFNNFIFTAHLGLDVPEGKCWLQVGDTRREWRNGKMLLFDTSFVHETFNEGDTDRYVLLIRFWHPEVTALERVAIQWLFDAVDDPTEKGFLAASKAADKRLAKLAKPQSKGFGAAKR